MRYRQQRVVANDVGSDLGPVVSGASLCTVLGPLLFSLYINGISVGISCQIRHFVEEVVRHREITYIRRRYMETSERH